MITLAVEVIYYKKRKITPNGNIKKKPINKKNEKHNQISTISTKQITIGNTFKPIKGNHNAGRISPIVLYPRARPRLPRIN